MFKCFSKQPEIARPNPSEWTFVRADDTRQNDSVGLAVGQASSLTLLAMTDKKLINYLHLSPIIPHARIHLNRHFQLYHAFHNLFNFTCSFFN